MRIDLESHRLIGELAAAMGSASSDDQRLEQAATILRQDDAGVRSLLDAIASDPALRLAIAGRSYWHSNGFAKLVLHVSNDPDFRVRLHVWADAGDGSCPPPVDRENIHSHRWPFASVLLAGSLWVEEFEEAPGADDDPKVMPCRKFVYETTAAGPVGRLEPVATCGLRRTGRFVYDRGDAHRCDTSTLHAVSPVGSGLTATLLVQGPASEDAALVYQRVGRQLHEDTGRGIDPSGVGRLVSAVLDALASAGG